MNRAPALSVALLSLSALIAPALAAARRAPPPGWLLEPGRALGPVYVGMTRPELSRVGPLSAHPSGSLGPNVLVSRAWTFFLDAGRLRLARRPLALTPGVVISGRRVAPASTLQDIARLRIPGCSRPQRRVGGEAITCRGRFGYAHFTRGAASGGRVEVDVSRDP